jgi:hypothetical protein
MTKDIEFINYLEKVDKEDDLKSIDIVYEYLDPIIDSKDFIRIMNIIEVIITKQFSLRVLIAVLTITHTQKNCLGNRQKIIDIIRNNKILNKKQNIDLTQKQIESILKGF